MADPRLLLDLLGEFARLGLMSFGGANLAEMERVLVSERHWMSAGTLASGFALGQLMPGPNMLAVTHYGYAIGGLAGAVSATLGFYGPTALLSAGVALAWQRGSERPWLRALRNALLPFGGGIILASALVLGRSSLHSWPAAALALLSFALLWNTRVNSALVVCVAAVAGAVLGL